MKECLDNKNNPDFMEKCYFLCKEFRFERTTDLIEGDTKILR